MNNTEKSALYEPLYPVAHAAHYLGINAQTLSTWVAGREYVAGGTTQFWRPLIRIDTSSNGQLSFINLVEAHVLRTMRKKHKIKMPFIRQAIDYVSREMKIENPLATKEFQTNGYRLFIEHLGELIDLSNTEQMQLSGIMQLHLQRIDRDISNLAVKLYPITREVTLSKKMIVINPLISFGRPIIEAVGVSTDIIANRWHAGDPFNILKQDYKLTDEQIEEAIWFEEHQSAEHQAA